MKYAGKEYTANKAIVAGIKPDSKLANNFWKAKETPPAPGNCNAWDKEKIYATPGTCVTYNNHTYINQWWTQNEQPQPDKDEGVWLSTECKDWSKEKQYKIGQCVKYGGHQYSSQRWNQGETPGISGGPWKENLSIHR